MNRHSLAVLFAVSLGVLAVGALPACKSSTSTSAEAAVGGDERAPCVRIMEVTSARVIDELELRANLMANRQTPVLPRSPGWVSELLVDAGDTVLGRETVMARISMEAQDMNVSVARAGIEMAEAGLNQVQLQLQQARAELARVETLRSQGAATEQQVEQVRTTVATLEELVNQTSAQVRMLRTQMRQAQDLASDSDIVAPFDGVVTQRLVEVGQLITSFPPTPLFMVQDPSQIRVIANVPERFTNQVHVGQEASVVLSDGRELQTTLSHVSPDLDLVSRTRRVWTLVDNPDGRLQHGGSAVLRIRLGETERCVLPRHAIARVEGNRAYLFALNADGRTVRELAVPLGLLQDEYYPVLDGLSVGDVIVEHGWSHLGEGMAVRTTQGESCDTAEE